MISIISGISNCFDYLFVFKLDTLMIPNLISFKANGVYSIATVAASVIFIPARGMFSLYAPQVSKLIKNNKLTDLTIYEFDHENNFIKRMESSSADISTKKWKLKNRFKVALSTENPPQSHSTIEGPTKGIAENKLVITVAPQKLI